MPMNQCFFNPNFDPFKACGDIVYLRENEKDAEAFALEHCHPDDSFFSTALNLLAVLGIEFPNEEHVLSVALTMSVDIKISSLIRLGNVPKRVLEQKVIDVIDSELGSSIDDYNSLVVYFGLLALQAMNTKSAELYIKKLSSKVHVRADPLLAYELGYEAD